MPLISKTFRVFLSSTFLDFEKERNEIQRIVVPTLEKLCNSHNCRFLLVDLRWGISEEAGLNQKALDMCLEEIRRSQKITPRPNFIFLLGDRYGYIPLPTYLLKSEYDLFLTNSSDLIQEKLIFFTSETSISVDSGSLLQMNGPVSVYVFPFAGVSPEYEPDGNIDGQYGFI